MLYLLAAVGALTVAVLLWRAFGAQAAGVTTRRERGPVAPDDDPEFLRGLDERNKKAGDDPPA
ncbi:hypothetical protein DMH04_39965 [Kibdelosporangium aridum]|uniref:Secreted protein n=1 Tax=Kibdelosporangium aridum TaxID=2030 RepID=A0A428YWF9_KIBAR|nr:hypothetical protein [Kibdelosporangium aridum]RSM74327.1 hypothetical protein DMH04_39965 [Kibdelosporangium aridum]